VAQFRCYLFDNDRRVIGVEPISALALPRAVTQGILAAVARQAATFELWHGDRCVYSHASPLDPQPPSPGQPTGTR